MDLEGSVALPPDVWSCTLGARLIKTPKLSGVKLNLPPKQKKTGHLDSQVIISFLRRNLHPRIATNLFMSMASCSSVLLGVLVLDERETGVSVTVG